MCTWQQGYLVFGRARKPIMLSFISDVGISGIYLTRYCQIQTTRLIILFFLFWAKLFLPNNPKYCFLSIILIKHFLFFNDLSRGLIFLFALRWIKIAILSPGITIGLQANQFGSLPKTKCKEGGGVAFIPTLNEKKFNRPYLKTIFELW